MVALARTAWVVRDYILRRGTGAATSGLRRRIPDRRTLAAGGAFTAFAVLSNLDVLLAKLLLSPHEAGVYAALATVEKIIIFLPARVAVVVVPNAARASVAQRLSGARPPAGGASRVRPRPCWPPYPLRSPLICAARSCSATSTPARRVVSCPSCAPARSSPCCTSWSSTRSPSRTADGYGFWPSASGSRSSSILALHSSPVEVATVQASWWSSVSCWPMSSCFHPDPAGRAHVGALVREKEQ